MKLFHTENNKEVVYVQMQDIIYISNETDMSIPASIFTKVFTGITIVNDSNRFDFVRFDDKHEVKFFKELDFIIDYDQYKNLTDKQLEEEEQKLVIKSNEITKKWNNMTEKEQKENLSLLDEQVNIFYMLNFICEIYAIKHGKRSMPFPEFVQIPEKPKKKLFFRKKKM